MTPVRLPARDWYRAAPKSIARWDHVPKVETRSRFNDGASGYALLYFAPNPVTALLEARALFGYPHTVAVEAEHKEWRVLRYRIDMGEEATVVDFGSPRERSAAKTNPQELTGDWEGRGLTVAGARGIGHLRYGRAQVPTQRLGRSIRRRLSSVVGLVVPSARMPKFMNLALYVARIRSGAVEFNGSTDIVI